jgi:hypothetical protein
MMKLRQRSPTALIPKTLPDDWLLVLIIGHADDDSCLVYFFAALAGVGYVDPETSALNAAQALTGGARFMPGAPVFVPDEDSEVARRRIAEERRELEKQWQKKKRPQDVS